MRSARDGLKANVLALVEAGADVTLESTEDVTEVCCGQPACASVMLTPACPTDTR
jgi:hypothetical protein